MIMTARRDIRRCSELAEATKRTNNLKVEERNKGRREGERRKVERSPFWRRQERTCKGGCKLVVSRWVQRKRMHKSSSLS